MSIELEGSRIIYESDGGMVDPTLALLWGLYLLEGMMAWLSQKLVVHGVNGPVVRKLWRKILSSWQLEIKLPGYFRPTALVLC